MVVMQDAWQLGSSPPCLRYGALLQQVVLAGEVPGGFLETKKKTTWRLIQ